MQIDPSLLTADDDILVVEDDIKNLKFLTDVLKEAGLHVRPASDGELALRSVRIKPPALILLDVRMPGMDGFEVCRILKSEEATRNIPVIFASGLGDMAEKIKGFELGAVDYVTKPLNAQEILMRVSAHLKLFLTQRRLEEQNHLLREAEIRFRTMANAAPVLIWMAGLDKLCNFFNQGWLAFTGRTLEQEMGNGWAEGVHPEDFDHCLDIYVRSFDARQPFAMEYRLRHQSGEFRWILDTGVPRYDDEGYFAGYIGACVDIDALKKNEAELKRAREAAETANRAKSIFLANMSHELRTPMNGVLGMAHLIRRGGVTPKQAEQLDKLDASGSHLMEIINAILDISKIEADRLTFEEVEVRLDRITADILTMIEPSAEVKQLKITIENMSQPCGLVGDPTRLKQALLNYAGNALKFTEQGSVMLRTRLVEESPDSLLIRFEVADTGIGIDPEVATRLFHAFEQADSSMTRKYGGTGLGLVITKKLAELMGGTAGCESALGEGSTFWFTARLKRSTTNS